MPEGLDFNNSGVLSGIPSSSGHFQFTAQVQDSDNPPQTDSLSLVLDVINNPPQITSSDTIIIKKLEELGFKTLIKRLETIDDSENNKKNLQLC